MGVRGGGLAPALQVCGQFEQELQQLVFLVGVPRGQGEFPELCVWRTFSSFPLLAFRPAVVSWGSVGRYVRFLCFLFRAIRMFLTKASVSLRVWSSTLVGRCSAMVRQARAASFTVSRSWSVTPSWLEAAR